MSIESAPEFESVEAFVEFCIDDEQETFSSEDLQSLNFRLHKPVREIRRELESYGLQLARREPSRRVRGFTANPHDRWSAFPSHGGSGWEQISGFSGQNG